MMNRLQPLPLRARSFSRPLATHRVSPIQLSPDEARNFSVVRAIAAAEAGGWDTAGFEREYSIEAANRAGVPPPDRHSFIVPPQLMQPQRRDLTVSSAAGGGYTVDTEVGGVIDALRPLLPIAKMGSVIVPGLKSNTTYARQGANVTVSWQLTEQTGATETASLAFGQLALTPKTMVAYVELSRLIRMMSPDLAEMTVRTELARAAAKEVMRVAIAGTGASGEPQGLLNVSGKGTFNGASVTYANTREAETDILNADALNAQGAIGFLCSPTVANVLAARQGFSTTAPIWTGPLAAGQVNGNPAFSSTVVPAATLIAGDWSCLALFEWGAGLEIRVNPVANFQAGIVGFGMFLSMDAAVLHPESFSIATSVS